MRTPQRVILVSVLGLVALTAGAMVIGQMTGDAPKATCGCGTECMCAGEPSATCTCGDDCQCGAGASKACSCSASEPGDCMCKGRSQCAGKSECSVAK